MVSRKEQLGRWMLLGAWLFCAVAAQAAEVFPLGTFHFANAAMASGAWVASPASPKVSPLPDGGVAFTCPFETKVDRVYWDHDAKLDLSRATSLELDFDCDRTDAMRSFNIYLKSGSGWYVWSTSVPEPGRQRLFIPRNAFTQEGKPAGWNRIESVRLSAWRGVPGRATLKIYALQARVDSILLIKNTLSTPSPAERSYSAKILQRISRWLTTLCIPHGVITDDEVEDGALGRATLAILPYNPHPPAREVAALRRFVEKGGKLIVFYGADPSLAELMGVRLLPYKRSDLPGQWSSFSFTDPAAWSTPQHVYQESPNIMPATPADDSTRVIAWWTDTQGRRSDDAAWLASPAGLWMTHVLLDDDPINKQNMLLGLVSHFEPAALAAAARGALDRAGKIDSFTSLPQTLTALRASAESCRDPKRVTQLLTEAEDLHAKAQALFERGRYADTIEMCAGLRAALVEAYGRTQQPRAHEFRGVWEHDGTGWYPGKWDRTCEVLSRNGITAVFPNMLWGGLAHYPSKVLPRSYTFKKFGDQLADCVESAHRRGLEVHVWDVCWNLSVAPAEFVEQMQKENRVQISSGGKKTTWLCPSHPANVQMALASIEEVVSGYEIDGLHLDYVRFPGSDYCYCSSCRSAFGAWLGKPIKNWPAAVQGSGPLAPSFRKWRVQQITSFVRTASERARALRPSIKVSAAVWGNYPACIQSVGQDWDSWLRKGYVDFVCPMNYTVDLSQFSTLTHAQLALPGAQGRIYPGIGVTADESQLRADQVIEQVAALRRLGAKGFMLFDLSHTLRDETLPALSVGATAAP